MPVPDENSYGYPEDDTEFVEGVVEQVEFIEEDKLLYVQFGDKDRIHDIAVLLADCRFVPRKGHTIRVYGTPPNMRGVFVQGAKFWYQTKEELEKTLAEMDKMSAMVNEKLKERFEKTKPLLDAAYDVLPGVFQKRIDLYRAANPEFRWRFEEHEMAVCDQAVLYEKNFNTFEELKAFISLPLTEQRKKLPELLAQHDEKSLCVTWILAMCYATNPADVPRMHGAACYITGCEVYGCAQPDLPTPWPPPKVTNAPQ